MHMQRIQLDGGHQPRSANRATVESRSQRPVRLDTLTGLRFFAAAAVLVFHLTPGVGVLNYGPGAHWWQFGYLGVPFFFALSGFVLTWTATPTDTRTAFWRRRFARVYPLYIACLAAGTVLWITGNNSVRVLEFVLSIFVLQAWFPGAALIDHGPNGPGWSISAETFFYAVFPWLLPHIQRRTQRTLWLALPAVVIWFWLAIVISNRHHVGYYTYFFPPAQAAFFVAGMVTAELVKRGVKFPPLWSSVALVVAAFVAAGAIRGGLYQSLRLGEQPFVELLSFPFVVILIGSAACCDIAQRPSPFRHHWLVKFGVWSYALYLVQYPLLLILLILSPHGFSSDSALATVEALAVIAIVIAVSGIAHKFVEAPWNERLRHAPPSIIAEQEVAAD